MIGLDASQEPLKSGVAGGFGESTSADMSEDRCHGGNCVIIVRKWLTADIFVCEDKERRDEGMLRGQIQNAEQGFREKIEDEGTPPEGALSVNLQRW
jgi:hypothetical protein